MENERVLLFIQIVDFICVYQYNDFYLDIECVEWY